MPSSFYMHSKVKFCTRLWCSKLGAIKYEKPCATILTLSVKDRGKKLVRVFKKWPCNSNDNDRWFYCQRRTTWRFYAYILYHWKKVAKKKSNVQIHREVTYPIWWLCFEIKVIHLWLHLEPKPKCFPWERSDFWPGYFFSLTSEFDMIMAEKKWLFFHVRFRELNTKCRTHACRPTALFMPFHLNIILSRMTWIYTHWKWAPVHHTETAMD